MAYKNETSSKLTGDVVEFITATSNVTHFPAIVANTRISGMTRDIGTRVRNPITRGAE